MKKPLADRILRVTERDVKAFHVIFDDGGTWKTWAIFYIDESTGTLAIVSDFGAWSHRWGGDPGQWGAPTFTTFLGKAGAAYIADKLCYGGRTRELADPSATRAAMRTHVLERRRRGRLDADEARQIWDDIDEFHDRLDEGNGSRDSVTHALCAASDALMEEFDSLWEWIEFAPHPKVTFLIEELIPAFQEVLRRREGETAKKLESVGSPEHM